MLHTIKKQACCSSRGNAVNLLAFAAWLCLSTATTSADPTTRPAWRQVGERGGGLFHELGAGDELYVFDVLSIESDEHFKADNYYRSGYVNVVVVETLTGKRKPGDRMKLPFHGSRYETFPPDARSVDTSRTFGAYPGPVKGQHLLCVVDPHGYDPALGTPKEVVDYDLSMRDMTTRPAVNPYPEPGSPPDTTDPNAVYDPAKEPDVIALRKSAVDLDINKWDGALSSVDVLRSVHDPVLSGYREVVRLYHLRGNLAERVELEKAARSPSDLVHIYADTRMCELGLRKSTTQH